MTQPPKQISLKKVLTKDYILLAETMFIVGLVGVGLYYFSNKDTQPAKVSVKKTLKPAATSTDATVNNTIAHQQEDDIFKM